MSNPHTNPRKRKADALVSADGDTAESPSAPAPSPPHLPPPCLAAVLNFMEYGSVRRCLLAGKAMAVDAARCVETLNVMRTSELVPSAARRFVNVSEVNILSLLTEGEETVVGEPQDALSASTAARTVPFLASFPKLERACLGGLYRDERAGEWQKFAYDYDVCDRPRDHRSIFRALVEQICEAFKSRVLNPNLRIEGLLEHTFGCEPDDEEESDEDEGVCRLCWNAATSLPLEQVTKQMRRPRLGCFCLSLPKCFEAMASRRRSRSPLHSQAMTKCFLDHVKWMMLRNSYDDSHFIRPVELEDLRKCAAFITPSTISKVPKSEFPRVLQPQEDEAKKKKLTRKTFEALVELGFALTSDDFVLI